MERYQAICIQPNIRFADPDNPTKSIKTNLDRCLELIDHSMNFRFFTLGHPIRLIAFPEWFIQGSHFPSLESFRKLCIKIPGEETDRLASAAKKHSIYICGHALETDDEWPNRFFSTAFIIAPSGKLSLKYRKLSTTNMLLTFATSPHDVLDRYKDDIFPVVQTDIGVLGCMVSYDRHFPEIARVYALRGVEVLIMPSVVMEPWGSHPIDWWSTVNRVRAHENLFYLVAPNAGNLLDTNHPQAYSSGHSQIIDFDGRVLAEAGSDGEAVVAATIDLSALKSRRSQPAWNFPAQLRTEVVREAYSKSIYPPNVWLEKSPSNYGELEDVFKESLRNLQKSGKS